MLRDFFPRLKDHLHDPHAVILEDERIHSRGDFQGIGGVQKGDRQAQQETGHRRLNYSFHIEPPLSFEGIAELHPLIVPRKKGGDLPCYIRAYLVSNISHDVDWEDLAWSAASS